MSPSPIRVVVATTVPGTLAGFFPRQLRSLAEAGFDVHAVSSPGAELDRLSADCGITTHAIPIERRPHPLRDAVSLARLIGLMRQLRPHIVHAHTPKAGLVGMAAAKAAGVPVRLYTVHGLPLLTRRGPWRKVLESAERLSTALSTRTYAVSSSVRELMIELKLCRAGKVGMPGDGSCCGVDLERFSARPDDPRRAELRGVFGIPEDAVVAAFVGRLAHDKGIGVLARAWERSGERIPGLHLLLAGEPDVTDPVPVEALDGLRRHARVHWMGSVPAARIPAVYAAADFCVLPTFREGLPQVALECGAMGRPIVSTRVSGVVSAVFHGRTGLLVEAHDPGELATAVERMASDPALRAELGAAAAEYVRTRFSADRVDALWMSEYRRLAESSVPGAIFSELRAEHRS